MKAKFLLLALALTSSTAAAEESVSRVLGSIDIEPNRTVANVSTVNGAIEIGAHANVAAVDTVNGHLRLGAGAKADSMSTVNGHVTLETGAQVKGKVTTVNGSMELAPGSEVGAELQNVNGDFTIDAAHVAGRLHTSTGSMTIEHGARIDGGILVDEGHHNWTLFGPGTPRIVIGPGAVIGGPLKFERKVNLFVSDQAVLQGPIEGAVAVRYSGDTAPR